MSDIQNDQQPVWQTEQDRIRATIQADIPTLERILVDDYFYFNSRGEIITKTDFLSALRTGMVKYESQDLDEVLIRVYESTAIVTGRLREKGAFQEQTFDEQFRFTRVYVRQANQDWRSVAYHSTRLLAVEQ